MARRKRTYRPTSTLDRTIERVAIAALAAVAARGSGESLAYVIITIFVIVVVIEEFGRRWIWLGKRVTLRDVALSSIGELRLQRARARAGGKKRKRRSRSRRRGRAAVGATPDKERRHIQGG